MLIFLQPWHLTQLTLLITSSLLAIGVVLVTRPYDSSFETRMYLFNECAVALMAYFLLIFTDMLPDYAGQELMGLVLDFIIATIVCINLIIVTYATIKMVIGQYIKNSRIKRKIHHKSNRIFVSDGADPSASQTSIQQQLESNQLGKIPSRSRNKIHNSGTNETHLLTVDQSIDPE